MEQAILIAVVIPCYRTGKRAVEVARQCLRFADAVICVDDNCPSQTGQCIRDAALGPTVVVLQHSENKGVGAATKSGIQYAIKHGYDVIVKLDSDGQMDPERIPALIKPLLSGKAQLCKGNRFTDVDSIAGMPIVRLIGNIGLGFMTKLSTGYWELFDPTNGFLALTAETAKSIQLHKTDNRYFFETDLLFRCGLYDIVVVDIPMLSIYQDEVSSLRPAKELIHFSCKHLQVLFKRIFYQYFLLDFNPGSIELIGGALAAVASFLIACNSLYSNLRYDQATPIGTQTAFLASIFIAVQLLLGFISYDAAVRPMLRRIKATLL